MDVGLRERKKARTRAAISAAAIAMFLDRGYDEVSVAEIAEAAEVSKRTLFAYFPTKDALVLHRFADHEDEPARVVRERAPGESPLAALHRDRRAALQRHDPNTGLSDVPEIVAFLRLVRTTPSLSVALAGYRARSEATLTAALEDVVPDRLAARLAACQVVVVLHELTVENHVRIVDGERAADLLPDALTATDLAFAMLRDGLAPFR
jgi:AcrR family transcriptional regulator